MSIKLLEQLKSFIKPAKPLPASTVEVDPERAAYNAKRLGTANHASFCYAPSVNMLFSQDGSVKACCHNTDFSIGKYPDQSIAEIWSSAQANQLREYMSNWDMAHGCQICHEDFKTASFNEVRARHFDGFTPNAQYPRMMEFLLTNTCNLECVMCKGEYSSLIRKNRDKLPPIVSPYNKEFIRQLEEFIPYLQETRFSGSGEAFAIDMNYEIWEMIIEKNPQCVIMVQTNGSYLNARIKNLLSRGNFQIGVSLDSLNKDTYEGIRVNANFDRVKENIQYFNEYSLDKKMKFSISTCIMRQNWKELPRFVEYCNGLNAVATFHKVWYPQEYALHTLPAEEIKEIYNYLAGFEFTGQTRTQKNNIAHYQYFTGVVKQWAEADRTAEIRQKEEEAHVNQLSAVELQPYLQNKLKAYLQTIEVNKNEQDAVYNDIITKLGAIIEVQQDEKAREVLMRHACKWPASLVVDSFNKNPIEYLFKESQRLVEVK